MRTAKYGSCDNFAFANVLGFLYLRQAIAADIFRQVKFRNHGDGNR